MHSYEHITYALRTIFVVDMGFSQEMAVSLYQESLRTSGRSEKVRAELERAFADPTVSWRRMLLNDEYEVADVDSEDEARALARQLLWDPLT